MSVHGQQGAPHKSSQANRAVAGGGVREDAAALRYERKIGRILITGDEVTLDAFEPLLALFIKYRQGDRPRDLESEPPSATDGGVGIDRAARAIRSILIAGPAVAPGGVVKQDAELAEDIR